jgi:hypothetical protein
MGNFATYRQINISGKNGIAGIFQIKLNRKGEFISLNLIPTIQKHPGIPEIDSKNQAIHNLRELSMQDFPNSKLIIKNPILK